MKYSIDIVPSPALISEYTESPAVAVVIDVLRASSTIITALKNGAKVIYPLEHVEEARLFANEGKLVGAERNVVRCDFARFGNDPFEYTSDSVKDQDIYFTTTNGTRTIKSCIQHGHQTIIGSFINLSSVAHYCRDKNVLAVCAGWKGRPCKEDILFAASLTEALQKTHETITDVTDMFVELYQLQKDNLIDYTKASNHYPRMVAAGKEDALEYCLATDLADIVPIAKSLDNGMIGITIY